MRLRCEIDWKGYVGLFRPRTSDSSTTFRLPAGGRGDVIVALGTNPVGKQFSTHSLWGAESKGLGLGLGLGFKYISMILKGSEQTLNLIEG